MFTNDDRQFLADLNKELANSIGKAIGSSADDSAKASRSAAIRENSEKVKENTDGSQVLNRSMKGATAALGVLSVVLGRNVQGALSYGDALARSATATGKSLSLLGTKYDSATGRFTNIFPGIVQEFKAFGISFPKVGQLFDQAIRMNIRETGRDTQKFIATSVGLGNSMNSVGRFLQTQTNVLGLSTEATTTFGSQILATAQANEILADSIFAAVDAFTKTTKEQTVVFGKETAAVMQKAVAGFAAVAPDVDAGRLLTALGSPEQLLKLPALTSFLGMRAVGAEQLRDPAQAERFVEAIIPALARKSQELRGLDPQAQTRLIDSLSQSFGQAFTLENLFTAERLAEELGGKRLGDIIAEGEAKALEDSARTIVRSADSANQAFTEFNLALGALKPTRDVFEGLATTIGDELTPAANGLTDTFVKMETALRRLGLTTLGAVGGAFAAGKFLMGRTATAAAVGGGAKGATAATAALSRADLIKSLTPTQLAKQGMKMTSAGNIVWESAEAAAKHGAKPGMVSTALLQKAAKPSMLSRAGGVLGKAAKGAPLIGGLITGGLEYHESGDVSRAVTRGAVTTGSTLAGAALGASIGSVVPVAGTIVGGIIGAAAGFGLDYFLGDKAVELHDALGFYENDPMKAIPEEMGEEEAYTTTDMGDLLDASLQQLREINLNTATVPSAGTPSTRFGFERPPEWDAGYFNSPTQR